jgi:4'-phosphopantetheinyl transferase
MMNLTTIEMIQWEDYDILQLPAIAKDNQSIFCFLIDQSEIKPLIIEYFYSKLSNDDQRQALTFHKVNDYRLFVVTRFATNVILQKILQIHPLIYKNSYGKPMLANNPLHFNLSHSGDYILLGICPNQPIGVDIELINSNFEFSDDILNFLHQSEKIVISNLSEQYHKLAFYDYWTKKEAIAKGLGHGLNIDFSTFFIDLNLSQGPMTVETPTLKITSWNIYTLNFKKHYIGALAHPQSNKKIHYHLIHPEQFL